MALDIRKERGTPLDRQRGTLREVRCAPLDPGDDHARVMLACAMERSAIGFSHAFSRMTSRAELRREIGRVRQLEMDQAVLLRELLPAGISALDAAVAQARMSLEITARLALAEPDPRLAAAFRAELAEEVARLPRLAELCRRIDGRAAGTMVAAPEAAPGARSGGDLDEPYDRDAAHALTKLHVLTLLAAAEHGREQHLTLAPIFADRAARALAAEIARAEEERASRHGSRIPAGESFLEKWLLHEAAEVNAYWVCHEAEDCPRMREIWARLVSHELGHLHHVVEVMESIEGRDPLALLPAELPDPIGPRELGELVREAMTASGRAVTSADGRSPASTRVP